MLLNQVKRFALTAITSPAVQFACAHTSGLVSAGGAAAPCSRTQGGSRPAPVPLAANSTHLSPLATHALPTQ